MKWWLGLLCGGALSAGLLRAEDPAAQSLAEVKGRLLSEVMQGRADVKRAEALAAAQSPDGSWPEIKYDAKDRMLWPPMEHLDRLAVLARASREAATDGAGQAAVAQEFVRGFDFWVARDLRSANWWYNEIGAVQSLYRTMLLAEPLLVDGRMEKGCALLARSKLSMTGQNLVWLAENVVGRACLQRDPALMAEAFKRVEAEIVVTEKEGIQPDFSFHQHGAQLYSGGYGNGFAASAPRFAVVGHSMGGQLAAMLAARHPERVIGAVGLSPVPASGIPMPPEVVELFSTCAGDRGKQTAILGAACKQLPEATRERLLDVGVKTSEASIRGLVLTFRQGGFQGP
jgi:chondroitin AC lyase